VADEDGCELTWGNAHRRGKPPSFPGPIQKVHHHPGKLLGHLIDHGNHTALDDSRLAPLDLLGKNGHPRECEWIVNRARNLKGGYLTGKSQSLKRGFLPEQMSSRALISFLVTAPGTV
jgi:hypothetical protein